MNTIITTILAIGCLATTAIILIAGRAAQSRSEKLYMFVCAVLFCYLSIILFNM